MFSNPSVVQQQIRAALKRFWGYDDFRYPQAEVITSLLKRQDALVVMPTGGGKSLCFQLPALLHTGLTIVISPLIALMENQVQQLQQQGLPAAQYHSELTPTQRRQTLRDLAAQELRLLYLSPESLLSEAIWQHLCRPELQINGLILDEAHCLVQWGDTFRPVYRRLGAVRPALLKSKPAGTKLAIAAFTATADPVTQETIRQVLNLQRPQVFRLSPYRPNLELQVKTSWTPQQRQQQLLTLVQAQNSSGLIYIRSRRESEKLAAWCQRQNHPTAAYHAGLSPQERRRIEADWLSDRLQFVVCTAAFGMGVNKPNVRWICHFHAPLTLVEYVQEVGRAGRDGKQSQALMLISEPTGWLDPSDRQRRQYFMGQVRSQQQAARKLLQQLPSQGNINIVARQFPEAAVVLAGLHSSGELIWRDPFHYQMRLASESKISARSHISAVQDMVAYLQTRRCRWQFILQAFGFTQEANGFRCGHCHNCAKAAI